ncbi:uncharacterized protein LOC132057801 [Lycium ferocissimum]|uniref:uncharacterized protein LOC132057801 n=1 Tax=Lycium ferocissimum TaxID=112874 RepID=UPI00281572F4|nr:uncharacterized protein LOC132057801 [Lycium ferocissimum]
MYRRKRKSWINKEVTKGRIFHFQIEFKPRKLVYDSGFPPSFSIGGKLCKQRIHCLSPASLTAKKQTTEKEPSVSDFYFRTHRKEKDKSWVNKKAEAAFNKFEKKKEELLSTQSASVDGDTNSASQLSPLSDMDIWALSVGGKKKGRVAGLGSLGRSVKVPRQSTSAAPDEVDEIRSQVHTLNSELYNRLEETQCENEEMRCQNKKMKKELGDTNKKLEALMKHMRFSESSSNAQPSSSEDNQDSESANDDNVDSDKSDRDEYHYDQN